MTSRLPIATGSTTETDEAEKSYELPFQLTDPDLLHFDSFVNNEWVQGSKSGRFEVVDPGTGIAWASCPVNTVDDVPHAVEAAHAAFEKYRKVTPRQRTEWLLKWHALLQAAAADLARILTYETGKPLTEATREIAYGISQVWWFIGEAERIRGGIGSVSVPGARVLTIKQPIGVAAALVPWNFPVALFLRKAATALAAGCTVVAKPSPETPVTAVIVAHLAQKAGFPPGALNVLTTDLENTPPLSEALCKHPLVKKVSFTGSTRVGKLIASHCSLGLKKLTLELGGNCPFIIFDDANLRQALEQLMMLKWQHAGQICVNANRIYVQAGIYEQFAQLFKEKASKIVVGHGAAEGTTMGSLTTPQGVEKAANHVADARRLGANVILGGSGIKNKGGYFFEPTIITNMTSEMLISREESFAPIAALYKFETEDEAVRLANDTSMGLGSYVFTKNVDRAWRVMENLETGVIGVNTGYASTAESPFGGVKESGYGKEGGKEVAVDEYLISKTVTLSLEDHY